MSKNISVSDEVYEKLKREKGDRSFSEVIDEKIESGCRISEVSGAKVLDRETMGSVKSDVRGGSEGSLKRVDDEVA